VDIDENSPDEDDWCAQNALWAQSAGDNEGMSFAHFK
jgi:hypothetical protein